jgi:lipopolysaccharide export system protein LptA
MRFGTMAAYFGVAFGVIALVLGEGAWARDGTPFEGLGHNSGQQIEIAANSLDVDAEANKAIFKGDVLVIQGPLRMRADSLEVHYTGKDDAAKAMSGGGTIRLIRARGDVVMTNSADAARASAADYDVSRGVITLSGGVLLAQTKAIIRGSRLTVHMRSGHAVMLGRVEASIDR